MRLLDALSHSVLVVSISNGLVGVVSPPLANALLGPASATREALRLD